MMRSCFFVALFVFLFSFPALAQETVNSGADLILPPALESPDAPFYRGAQVKMGAEILPVIEDKLPNGSVAEYRPERNAVIVNSDANISENRKGQALLDVVSSMSVFDVETAAGPAKK